MLKIKCPICGQKYVNHDGVYSHMTRMHSDEIPKGMGSDQYYYDLTHNGKRTKCIICKKDTPWNERTHKYHRLCGSEECNKKNREIFQQRMMKIHGTDNLAKDPEHRRKMLEGRSISGIYKWSTGGETHYVGSYEEDFLHICDSVLDLHQADVIPSPFTYQYMYDGKKHFYIPDFYIPDLKLEIEVKDGGENPNMHPKIQAVDKEKERLKDICMIRQHTHHYIKIVNKRYGQFINLVNKLIARDLTKQEQLNKIKVIPGGK